MKMLLAGLALAVAAHQPVPVKPVNYAGSWTLDVAQSRSLPDYYARVKSHRLTITQDDARMDIAVEIDIGGPEPDRLRFSYPLDGTPVETETGIRMRDGLVNVPTTLRARVDDAGAVHITISRRIPMPDRVVVGETWEDWALSPDGRTLTIHRVDDTPRGRLEADMVFVRS